MRLVAAPRSLAVLATFAIAAGALFGLFALASAFGRAQSVALRPAAYLLARSVGASAPTALLAWPALVAAITLAAFAAPSGLRWISKRALIRPPRRDAPAAPRTPRPYALPARVAVALAAAARARR